MKSIIAAFLNIKFSLSGFGIAASGQSGERQRALENLPKSLSDGKHNLEENEPELISYGKDHNILGLSFVLFPVIFK